MPRHHMAIAGCRRTRNHRAMWGVNQMTDVLFVYRYHYPDLPAVERVYPNATRIMYVPGGWYVFNPEGNANGNG